jgi:hypothetical protein
MIKHFQAITKFPEVIGAALSDSSGALLDCAGNIDGEAAGAVHAYAVQSLAQGGALLGLGAFLEASVVGPTKACVIALHGETVLGVYVDPSKPLALFEKKLHEALQR